MIRFESVDKFYPKELGEKQAHQALHHVSFQLSEGQTLGMVGPNGAGKSTCIRLMMGFMQHSAGKIQVFNNDPMQHHQHQKIGYLPESSLFPQNLSCLELLRFAAKSCLISVKRRDGLIQYWLERLGLWGVRHRLLRNFSKGMQQRTSFAMALIHEPPLLILDEPMSGLDPVGRMEIVALIKELREQGKTILFCSHILDDVERLADQVLILHQGRVCFQGTSKELCQQQSDWQVLNKNQTVQHFSDQIQLSNYVRNHAEDIKSIQNHESFESAFLRKIKECESL